MPGDDPQALAAGLAKVLSDPDLRADWGRRGRQVAQERYAWPIVARQIEAIYAEVLESKGVDVRRGAAATRRST